MPRVGMPATLSSWLHIPIFAFLLVKIIMRGQLYQQLVRAVAHICYRFFAYKNCNTKAAMPAADTLVTV